MIKELRLKNLSNLGLPSKIKVKRVTSVVQNLSEVPDMVVLLRNFTAMKKIAKTFKHNILINEIISEPFGIIRQHKVMIRPNATEVLKNDQYISLVMNGPVDTINLESKINISYAGPLAEDYSNTRIEDNKAITIKIA